MGTALVRTPVSYPAAGIVPPRTVWESSESRPPDVKRPRLLDRVRETIRARHFSRRTERAYVGWIKRYVFFHGKRHPAEMGEAEISSFLSNLAIQHHVSASTQTQALSALLFLYREVLHRDLARVDRIVRAKTPKRLPVVLSRQEVNRILQHLEGARWIMATLLYGAGLRLMECVQLRVQDLDFATNQILVRGGKGNKDRVTVLPAAVKDPLTRHLDSVRRQHQADLSRGAGWVALPGALGLKYPNAGREWGWQWAFPATRFYRDAETGQRRRHHLHESALQRAVKEAVLRAGSLKPASCHTFRHRSQHTCSRTVTAFARSRSCSGIGT